ncbi:MAG TPA: hypothetical protein VK558_15070 [Patescibacteria group bacterium]|nr:hypothetical protein [Patescibacteria group bacterium]
MLTVDEIEDSFEVHFRQQVEDLPDETLHAILNDMHVLRRYAPPSLAASRARDIVGEILRLRVPAPEPEPVIVEAAPEPEAAAAPPPATQIEPYFEPELAHDEPVHSLEPELRFEALPEPEPAADTDDSAAEDRPDEDDTTSPAPLAAPARPFGRWVVAAVVVVGGLVAIALLR